MTNTNLQIIAFYKPDGNKKQAEKESFMVDFNPSTFTINNKIEFKKDEAKGKTGGDPQFDKIPPLEFSIEFTVDGTGVVSENLPNKQKNQFKSTKQQSAEHKNDYVKNRVKELRKVTGSDINGEIHRPNYLAVLWGTFFINCVLTSISITYNLFDRYGSPLRAKINLGFLERKGPGAEGRETMLESPDLTKYKVVIDGDILPLIAKENYEDSSFYIQIARANKLKNFRRLQPGSTLTLPPMKDSDE
ncbi:MAG: hypothetical protein ABIQ31_02960 [Ferruginibacter sp.]